MLKVLGHRLLLSIPLLFFVSVLTFVLVSLTPGDPAVIILGQNRPLEEYARLRAQLGFNDPLWSRYANWLGDLLRGNLGVSIFNGESVVSLLNGRMGVTLSLVVGTTIITSLIGITLGVFSAVRKGLLARLVDILSLFGLAVPNFWLALILVAIFAINLKWLPAIGYVEPTVSLIDWLKSLVLPIVILTAPAVGFVAQQTRNAMLEVFESNFIRTLKAGGATTGSIIYKHALRNAAIPIITVIGLNFVGLLSGTVIAETIFALPGLGSLAVQSTQRHDLPIIQGIVLYFTVIVVVVNFIIDVAYAWLNPKVRIA